MRDLPRYIDLYRQGRLPVDRLMTIAASVGAAFLAGSLLMLGVAATAAVASLTGAFFTLAFPRAGRWLTTGRMLARRALILARYYGGRVPVPHAEEEEGGGGVDRAGAGAGGLWPIFVAVDTPDLGRAMHIGESVAGIAGGLKLGL